MFSSFCFIYAVMNPWNYNGINGLLGSFLGTQTLVPFIISTAATVSYTHLRPAGDCYAMLNCLA